MFIKAGNKTLWIVLLWIALGSGVSSCNTNHSKKIDYQCVDKHMLSEEKQVKLRKNQENKQKIYRLDTLFTKKAKTGRFNGAVLIAQKGVVLYQKVFGLSDFREGDSLTPDSRFQLASVSKTFTGVAIQMLIEEGLAAYHDSIQKYIPNFPYHGISIENLLSHRSGLPNYMYAFDEKKKLAKIFPDNDSIISWFIHAPELPKTNGQPGKFFNYCNTNYIILAKIIEIISGQSYPAFMDERIFKPLGMNHTCVDTFCMPDERSLITRGHHGSRQRERDFYDGVYGDKGIFSTAGDMYRWYVALKSNCLLSKKTTQNAFTPRSFERKSRHNYALGFRIITDREDMHKVKHVYHGGWWAGYSTMFWFNPDEDYVIIMLSNRKSRDAYDINPVLDILGVTDPELNTDAEE